MLCGINFISSNDWTSYQLPAFRAMKPTCAKVNLFYDHSSTPAFGSNHLDNILDSGVNTVIFRGAETDISVESTERQLLTPLPGWNRPVLDYIVIHPERQFLWETGNEPDQGGVNPWVQRWHLLNVGHTLIPRYRQSHPNLHWIASMATDKGGAGHSGEDYFSVLVSNQGDGTICALYDALGVHAYGFNTLFKSDGNHPWAVADWVHGYAPGTKIWVTEAGINSTDPWKFKCELYRKALTQPELANHNIQGVTFFTLSRDPQWCRDTHYGIDVNPDGRVEPHLTGMNLLGTR